MGFLSGLKRLRAEVAEDRERVEKERYEKEVSLQGSGRVYCPKCLSTSISIERRGFKVGRAIAGGFVFGGFGLLGGAIGANKKHLYCMSCGNRFMPRG